MISKANHKLLNKQQTFTLSLEVINVCKLQFTLHLLTIKRYSVPLWPSNCPYYVQFVCYKDLRARVAVLERGERQNLTFCLPRKNNDLFFPPRDTETLVFTSYGSRGLPLITVSYKTSHL